MKIFTCIVILLLISCTGTHPLRNNVDVNELKTLPDNLYMYWGKWLTVSNDDITVWYNIDDNRNIINIYQVANAKSKKDELPQIIEKSAIDTIRAKATAVLFTRLSHKYGFVYINVEHKNKIAYATYEGIREEYVYPLNDSVMQHYQNDFGYGKLENGWFGRID